MSFLNESSLTDLYKSAVLAFPNTTKRQHATGPVQIEELRWTPFLGVKTLFVRGEAVNEDRRYHPVILFKKVDYEKKGARVVASDGLPYTFGKLSTENNQVLLRCNCQDFHWRFNYYNWEDRSLYSAVRKPYESLDLGPPANPSELPGMCKHLMKMVEVLKEMLVFSD
jgi:hypothetical protein